MAELIYLTRWEAQGLAEYIAWAHNEKGCLLLPGNEMTAFNTLQKIAGVSHTLKGGTNG